MTLRDRIHEIIFEADTPEGKLFDALLMVCIFASITFVALESVDGYRKSFGDAFRTIEWVFTILFTVEYLLRLYAVRKPLRYAFSFFGIVDVLAIAPAYLGLLFNAKGFLFIRVLRLMRVFRVFKLPNYLEEARVLGGALRASQAKISVFLFSVCNIVVVIGAIMYVIEGPENGFASIPLSIYWAIVTLTTVGYGDIAPQTTLGQVFSSIVMIMGYAIIAVPTGIMSVEISRSVARKPNDISTRSCPDCGAEGHDQDAAHCKYCGAKL